MAAQSSLRDIKNGKVITPIVPDDSRIRMEIDELLADNEMTNLFLLALEAMQTEDPEKSGDNEDWWTFYSLAGIHGSEPREKWNGISNGDTKPPRGYCKHSSVLFPTWHRVYIYMFEQAVFKKMNHIAELYPDGDEKTQYKSVANRFRLPFWDPLLPRNNVKEKDPTYDGTYVDVWGLPKLLGAETVWVKRPKVTDLEEIPNPLYRFKFPRQEVIRAKGRQPIDFSGFDQLSQKGRLYTNRTPGEDGGSVIYGYEYQNGLTRTGLNLNLQRQGAGLMTKLWQYLAPYSGTNPDDGRKKWESFALEHWHDGIHNLIGTGIGFEGHMGNTAVAGFDPIFWLHHCNIDRILAIYQALYDEWVPPSDLGTKLYPFLKTEGDFWSSKDNEIKDWTRLGFAIPGSKPLDKAARSSLEAYIHEYYSWGPDNTRFPPASVRQKWPKNLSNSVALHGPDAQPVHTLQKSVIQFEALQRSSLVTRSLSIPTLASTEVQIHDEARSVIVENVAKDVSTYLSDTIENGYQHTWNARIRVLKFAFDGSFNIHLFIGQIMDTQPERFITKKNEVGFAGVFASADDAQCANCDQQREQGLIYEDSIPITSSLSSYLRSNIAAEGPEKEMRTLESFRPVHVVPFLKEHLHWVITDTASRLIHDEQDIIRSKLEILVSTRGYDVPTDSSPLGLYHPAEDYPEISTGKIGGYNVATGTPA